MLLLPKALVGFFAAVMVGAIFSSFNSALVIAIYGFFADFNVLGK